MQALQQDLKTVHDMIVKLDEQTNLQMLKVGTEAANLSNKDVIFSIT